MRTTEETMANHVDRVLSRITPYTDEFIILVKECFGYTYSIHYKGEWITLEELAKEVGWYIPPSELNITFMGGPPSDRRYTQGNFMTFVKDLCYLNSLDPDKRPRTSHFLNRCVRRQEMLSVV